MLRRRIVWLALCLCIGCDSSRSETRDPTHPSSQPPSPAWKRACNQAKGLESYCLRGKTEGREQVFEIGGTVQLQGAIAMDCVSSSHHKVEGGKCTLEHDGKGNIRVEHELCLLENPTDGPQTADCLRGGTPVQCRTPPLSLEQGQYTLTSRLGTIRFDVPSRVPSKKLCLPVAKPPKQQQAPKPFRSEDL